MARYDRSRHTPASGPTRRATTHQIELSHVTKHFPTRAGGEFTALQDVSFTVASGQFCALVGPSGCGKSAVLAMIAGLEQPGEGGVYIDGTPVTTIPEDIGFVFQTDALLPWKTVLGNVEAGPRFRGVGKLDACTLARDWLRRVGLAGFEDRYPHHLSVGMRRRVALAAALINEPKILLMDEPFSSLDVQTKAIMQNELMRLWEQPHPTVVFATHDIDEAVALADKVVVMTPSPGTTHASFDVTLPRPRQALDNLRCNSRFIEARRRIWQLITDTHELAEP